MAPERPGFADFPDDLRAHAAWLRRLAVSLVGAGPHSEDAVPFDAGVFRIRRASD
jgi:hypothetical protein